MRHEAMRVREAGANVLGLEPSVAAQDGLRCVPRRQHPEHVLDRQPTTTNDRLPVEHGGGRFTQDVPIGRARTSTFTFTGLGCSEEPRKTEN